MVGRASPGTWESAITKALLAANLSRVIDKQLNMSLEALFAVGDFVEILESHEEEAGKRGYILRPDNDRAADTFDIALDEIRCAAPNDDDYDDDKTFTPRTPARVISVPAQCLKLIRALPPGSWSSHLVRDADHAFDIGSRDKSIKASALLLNIGVMETTASMEICQRRKVSLPMRTVAR